MLHSELLGGVAHAFSTRAPLDPETVMQGAVLVRVKQVHSADVAFAAEAMAGAPEADALVTDQPGLLLGIVTADCAPVLLHDAKASVVAAAHAGWRGAHAGVLENTVAAMVALGAEPAEIVAAIGPTIAQSSYEVDPGLREKFSDDDARFFAPGREDHWQFDLPAYVRHRLERAGLTRIEDLGEDTYEQPERFFSFRRATHRSEDTGGRQLSVIGLPG